MNNHDSITLYLMHVIYCGLEICTLLDFVFAYFDSLTSCVLSLLCNWPQTKNLLNFGKYVEICHRLYFMVYIAALHISSGV